MSTNLKPTDSQYESPNPPFPSKAFVTSAIAQGWDTNPALSPGTGARMMASSNTINGVDTLT